MEALRAERPEFRRAEALACPIAGMIALIVMASAQGVTRGPQDLADDADTLSQAQWRALRFRRDVDSGEIRCPKKTTFGRNAFREFHARQETRGTPANSPVWQSQRDCVVQPRVARHEPPWVTVRKCECSDARVTFSSGHMGDTF